jgi:hypothetical protein
MPSTLKHPISDIVKLVGTPPRDSIIRATTSTVRTLDRPSSTRRALRELDSNLPRDAREHSPSMFFTHGFVDEILGSW